MSRRQDLERAIRESYDLIREQRAPIEEYQARPDALTGSEAVAAARTSTGPALGSHIVRIDGVSLCTERAEAGRI